MQLFFSGRAGFRYAHIVLLVSDELGPAPWQSVFQGESVLRYGDDVAQWFSRGGMLGQLHNRGRWADKHGNLWRVYELNHTDNLMGLADVCREVYSAGR